MGRVYNIGYRKIKIPQKVIDQIITWNTEARDDVRFDEKVTHLLLLSLVHKDKLCASIVDDDVMEFVKGMSCVLVN